MRKIRLCPICERAEFHQLFELKDHHVSHETFSLVKCLGCGLVATSPQPEGHDLEKYYQSETYISHSTQNKSIIDITYRISRYFTLRNKHQIVHRYTNPGNITILDFGCGTGDFLKVCYSHRDEVYGVEPSAKARKIASEKTRTEIFADLQNFEAEVDAITAWHVLEHVPDPNRTFEELRAHLKKNGTIFIAVPNHDSPDAKLFGQYWAGYDVPRHLWHFNRDTMERLLKKHNFALLQILPMKLDAYYVSILSNKYRHGNNSVAHLFASIATGLKSNFAASKDLNYSSLIYIAKQK